MPKFFKVEVEGPFADRRPYPVCSVRVLDEHDKPILNSAGVAAHIVEADLKAIKKYGDWREVPLNEWVSTDVMKILSSLMKPEDAPEDPMTTAAGKLSKEAT